MNSTSNADQDAGADAVADAAVTEPAVGASRAALLFVGLLAVLGLVAAGMLGERVYTLQQQAERQGAQAIEAGTLARQAQQQVRDTAIKVGTFEARLTEVAQQSAQIEEIRQHLTRTRDETLALDIESMLRLAQQQAELTGSVQPLMAALAAAEQRLARAAQPRLGGVQRAVARDTARIKALPLADVPTLLAQIDEIVRGVDALPLANAVARPPELSTPTVAAGDDEQPLWQRSLEIAWERLRSLVRVSRIDHPEAVLMSPEQSYFVRENLKLRLLNARLGLLTRQHESTRADLQAAVSALQRYFDVQHASTRAAVAALQQTQARIKQLGLPRADDTLAALAALSGR